MIVFYTINHSKGLEEVFLRQVHHPQIIWQECMIGNNALDYQLIGVLAYLIVRHPKASFCIYSGDKGYDTPVDFWRERGIRISRNSADTKKKAGKKAKKGNREDQKIRAAEDKKTGETGDGCQTSKAKKAGKNKKNKGKHKPEKDEYLTKTDKEFATSLVRVEKAEQTESTNDKELSAGPEKITKAGQLTQDQNNKEKTKSKNKKKKQPEQNSGERKASISFLRMYQNQEKLTERQYLAEIGKCVAASDLQGWCHLLAAVFGEKDGGEWYQKIRRDIQMREQLSKDCMKNVRRRCVHAAALVLHANGLDAGAAEAACTVIRSHAYRDFNAIKIDFDKRPEFKQQNQYYKVLRPLIALLQKW